MERMYLCIYFLVMRNLNMIYIYIWFILDLPPDSLDGHRDRFYLQHRRLKTFCFEAAALSYVTNLTAIPNIPEVSSFQQ